MKTILTISTHSIIDVITNSSSELFVCDTNKSAEAVLEILASNNNMHGYQTPWVFKIEEYRKWKDLEKARLANWRYGDVVSDEEWENPYRVFDGWFFDIEDEGDLEEIRKDIIEDGNTYGGWWSSERNFFGDRLYKAKREAEKKYPGDWKKQYDAEKKEVEDIYNEIKSSETKPDWWINPLKYNYHSTSMHELDGKIIIMSTDDNSIPYDEFDWIEETFHAERYHLG